MQSPRFKKWRELGPPCATAQQRQSNSSGDKLRVVPLAKWRFHQFSVRAHVCRCRAVRRAPVRT